MIALKSSMFAYAALAFTSVSLLAQEQPNKRLWVLQEPGAIVEYDAATFAPKQTQKIPLEIFRAPQDLQINQKGQMLCGNRTDLFASIRILGSGMEAREHLCIGR